MMVRFFLLVAVIFCASCSTTKKMQKNWNSEDVMVFEKFDDMEYIFNQKNDTTYVINFWATWCAPCVRELPYFESLHDEKWPKDKPVELILVSLDLPNMKESKLIPFLNENRIESEVLLLADGNANSWIDRVDPRWSGSIPITVIYKGNERLFFEREFHNEQEIIVEIEKVQNN